MLQSEREKGLSHLLGKWMSSPVLQRAMLNAGINIFVSEHTDKYVSTCAKVCTLYVLAFRIREQDIRFGSEQISVCNIMSGMFPHTSEKKDRRCSDMLSISIV